MERLQGQMKRLRQVITAILRLTDELKERTIEKVMAKSDVELGLEYLPRRAENEQRKGKH